MGPAHMYLSAFAVDVPEHWNNSLKTIFLYILDIFEA